MFCFITIKPKVPCNLANTTTRIFTIDFVITTHNIENINKHKNLIQHNIMHMKITKLPTYMYLLQIFLNSNFIILFNITRIAKSNHYMCKYVLYYILQQWAFDINFQGLHVFIAIFPQSLISCCCCVLIPI